MKFSKLKILQDGNYVFQYSQGIIHALITYTFLFIIIHNTIYFFSDTGIIENTFNLSSRIKQKSQNIAIAMQEKNLALNFLANIRKLSFFEAKQFQSSGLIHLLAISGGQVVPLASGFGKIISYSLYYSLRNSITPFLLIDIINKFRTFFAVIISLFLCHMFGCTGALIRVSSLTYLIKIKNLQAQHLFFFPFFPYIPSSTFTRFFVLILISIFFGNILYNFSFLLSAIGATCAEISIYLSYFFIKKSKLLVALASTCLTSIFTGIILSPFSSIHLLNSCLANILALPIVCFLITPLTLIILIIPEDFLYYKHFINIFDLSLKILKQISIAFSDPYNIKNPYDRNNPLFKLEGLLYLSIVLVVLWVILDLYKERKIFYTRYHFQKLKLR
ncbi:ComEC/Rec2 family competence protein [Fluviispira vulneris]|uniref:ComEC/Rec2 family competence protein n=1 Tax=Fluviispira vulneris TaxID=2763012 RepID=UPI001647D07E|nr:ComEC/Rec2 family competence protein [Fluviispira vulneris]